MDITVQVLSLGMLYNGTSAARFFDGIWSDETTGDQLPNNAAKEFRSTFYNNAFTLAEYKKQLKAEFYRYSSMGWAKRKIYLAKYHIYRINILLGGFDRPGSLDAS